MFPTSISHKHLTYTTPIVAKWRPLLIVGQTLTNKTPNLNILMPHNIKYVFPIEDILILSDYSISVDNFVQVYLFVKKKCQQT